MLTPLNNLLQKATQWNWTETQQTALNKAKSLYLLQSSVVLSHYDPSKSVSVQRFTLQSGAVLSYSKSSYYELLLVPR